MAQLSIAFGDLRDKLEARTEERMKAEAALRESEERPDLIILDVGMPGLDGYAVCRILKEDARTARIPVVLLTARAQQQGRLKGVQAGADAYLTKPFKPVELCSILNTFLER